MSWTGAARLVRVMLFTLTVAAVAPGADLVFQRLALHQYEDGPLLAPSYEYLPGETVWFSARVNGYEREVQDREEELDRARLTWQLRAVDPAGTLIVPPMRGLIEETLRAKEDREWVPKFAVSFVVPSHAVRGEYRIPVTVHDDISKREASGEVKFRVRGEEAPPADALLGVRDFRFLAREDDRVALRPAVYKQGSPLFAKFEMIGYAFEGNNHFSVEYGLEILGPPNAEGVRKTMFGQEKAAAESSEAFYAQRWVPAGFGLNLDPDIAPGEYTLVIRLRDKVSGKTADVSQAFQVR